VSDTAAGEFLAMRSNVGGRMTTKTQVIAHRGASRAETENTIAAFRRAVHMGAQSAELDVRRTLDGVLVVHHNPALDDGRVLAAMAFADLPDHVCTLDEALDACAPMWVNVEIKNDPSEPDFDVTESIADDTIACLVDRPEGDSRWLISSFRRETIDRCRELRPTIPTAWLTLGVRDEDRVACINSLSTGGHVAIHPWFGHVSADMIADFHAAGLSVNTWTCDDPERMRELIDWGIDGICTNVPDVALAVIESMSGGEK
jgi:glycerophosphoryl diester phosphodiesterase